MTRRAPLLLLLLCAALALAAAPQTTLSDIEDEVMCPVCGVALNIAESPQADDQRALIRDLIADGLTKDEIKAELVAEYGRAVLADPDDEGFSIANWLVPAAVVVVLLGTALALLPRWRRRQREAVATEPAAATGAPLDAEDARRLDADLDRFR